ncbi:MAG: hypothetical protein IPH75_13930 [bacterium]|nr:hypothetical protein [bacterium]
MWRKTTLPLLLLSAIVALLFGCGQQQQAQPQLLDDIGIAAFTDSTLDFPPMQYANGQLTINDRCPVRKVPLNRRLSPLFVNGKPLGFC